MDPAKISYLMGNRYAYDDGELGNTWMLRAARGIVNDFYDRYALKEALTGVDLDIRIEIIARMAEIIKIAYDSEEKKA